jgi:2-desacetyl-2-hydroxyethyl bacteriochlorophyllide A dehydrogenase
MSKKCRAVVFAAKEKVQIQNIELPDVGADQIGVKTLYSGISAGSELWILTGKFWNVKFPNIPGYQKVGVVEEVGKDVKNYKEGDIVFLRTTAVEQGLEIRWAGHTGYSVIDACESYMFKIPESIDPASASLLCMSAVGYHGAAEVMPVGKGENVAVIGLGLIGQFSAQTANIKGADVIAIDLIDSRLDLAAKYANATVLNVGSCNVTEEIKKLCPDGLDVVIDASANVKAVNESFQWLRKGGRYCFQGYYHGQSPLDLLCPHIKELVFYNPIDSTVAGARHCAQMIAEGKMNMEGLITHKVSMENAIEVYETLLKNPKDVLGAVIEW